RALILAGLLLALAGPAAAVTPDEQLDDPALEARARELSRELRCVVCQNQSIDESDAALAHDLRIILRERLLAGDTDAQAKAYLVQRYGSYVLLRPPLNGDTLALWLGPLAALALGGAGVAVYLRGRAVRAPEPLDAADEARVAKLLNPDEAS
ncbi:MAG: Cytochrome c heme lyase subunit CcmL, partial [Caulobacteraceae bacterium]|nr:Cytochrome c heme lyase subunit CcmL [Caulobacteraceae bacterium]